MAKSKTKLEKLNENGLRKSGDRRKNQGAAAEANKPAVDRRKIKRRRQIDPTTCEREYSELEIEFMQAMDEYKRASGRMFPTCSEILEVFTGLGYRKVAEEGMAYAPVLEADDNYHDETEEDFV